jgi:serine/threonine protein kinase
MLSLEGQQLGPYRIVTQLGSGGMATVYKAYHARLDRYVAIKMMHQAFLQDQNFLTRFEREAQIVARLEHPHIVPIFDFADFSGQPYLVMKFIEGRTLKAVLNEKSLTLDEIQRIMPAIADALDYAHRRGVLHRDIKPSNIIIDNEGVAYLTDFGLARMAQLGESTLSHDVLLGTPHYISPEQALGRREITPKTDIYSLGVVLYELVVGRVPFSADTPFAIIHDHIYRPLPKPSTINPDITPEVEAVLVKALSKEPNDRYETATEMMNAFKAAVNASGLRDLHPQRASFAEQSLAKMRDDEPMPKEGEQTNLLPRTGNTPPPVAASASDSQVLPPAPTPIRAPVGAAPPMAPTPPRPPQPPRIPLPQAELAKRADDAKRKVEFSLDFSQGGLRHVGEAIEQAVGAVGEAIEGVTTDPDIAPEDDESAMRLRIEKQFNKRREFFGHLITFAFVNIVLWAIFLSGAGDLGQWVSEMDGMPWPMFVTFGWGAGLVAHAIETRYDTGKRAARRLTIVREAYRQEFGENWRNVKKSELKRVRRRAEKPFNERKEFFEHLGVYTMINAMFWTMFLTSNGWLANIIGDADVARVLEFPWPLAIMFFWGIGLVAHGMEALGAQRREDAIQRALDRERAQVYREKPKRDQYIVDDTVAERRVRLTEDGEFTDSIIAEMEAEEKPKRRS